MRTYLKNELTSGLITEFVHVVEVFNENQKSEDPMGSVYVVIKRVKPNRKLNGVFDNETTINDYEFSIDTEMSEMYDEETGDEIELTDEIKREVIELVKTGIIEGEIKLFCSVDFYNDGEFIEFF